MINIDIIRSIKSATVAIGIVTSESMKPRVLCGSGFYVDKKGYVMTAGHVGLACLRWKEILEKKGEDVKIAVFRTLSSKDGVTRFEYRFLNTFRDYHISDVPEGFSGPANIDVGIGKTDGEGDVSFLPIKTPSKLSVYDEIAMCGYPRGEHSLSIIPTDEAGMRFSPLIQFGRIAGLMPTDDVLSPYGIQTDIVGSGGSSGSPLITLDGQVIGIAQAVIPAGVTIETKNGDLPKNLYGIALMGLVYGVTNNMFYNIPENAKIYFEKGIDIKSRFETTSLIEPTFSS